MGVRVGVRVRVRAGARGRGKGKSEGRDMGRGGGRGKDDGKGRWRFGYRRVCQNCFYLSAPVEVELRFRAPRVQAQEELLMPFVQPVEVIQTTQDRIA